MRTISVASGTRVAEFRDTVQQRDQRCVITGQSAVRARGSWTGFDATHIFPWHMRVIGFSIILAVGLVFIWVVGVNQLSTKQDIYSLFDSYGVSINLDVGVPLLEVRPESQTDYIVLG